MGAKRQPRARFRDTVDKVIRDGRREKIKKQLLEGMERLQFESYRKSNEELQVIKEKQVKKFYEDQNDALDSWLEVFRRPRKPQCQANEYHTG